MCGMAAPFRQTALKYRLRLILLLPVLIITPSSPCYDAPEVKPQLVK
jgi:hypothetical protein